MPTPRFETAASIAEDALCACPDCDLLMASPRLEKQQQARCPRCKCSLGKYDNHSIERCTALCISGLLLFIPAHTLDLIRLPLFGQVHHESILTGIIRLFNEGHEGIAGLILCCSVLFPLLRLLSCALTLMPLRHGRRSHWQIRSYKLFHWLSTWSMQEIYLLGIAVAVIKLNDISKVEAGFGLFCLSALICCTLAISHQLNDRVVWQRLELKLHV